MKIAVLEEVARTGKCMAFSNAVHAVQKGMPNPINIALLELSHDLRLINQTAQLAI